MIERSSGSYCPENSAPFSPLEISQATGGKLLQGALSGEPFSGVSIDSRTLRRGQLFLALQGNRWDGHEFVASAISQGAAGAVVSRWPLAGEFSPRIPVWLVSDTVAALGELAHLHRRRFKLPVAAITGSCGKTTTKAMIVHLLSQGKEILATPGTQNNLIGVPMTLLRLAPGHTAVVLELGTNRWGEIERLAHLVSPTVGAVTNIGPAHLETFRDLGGVLREKWGLFKALDPKGTAVLNADDPLLLKKGGDLLQRVIWYGTHPQADVRASRMAVGAEGSRCLINDRWKLDLPLPGRHNLTNALAALACAKALGVELPSAIERLKGVDPLPGRLRQQEWEGCRVFDDSYNANPASFQAALEVLVGSPRSGRKILVMGDMLELGAQAEGLHAEAGRQAAQAGIDLLVAIGPLAAILLKAACEAGFPESSGRSFKTTDEAGDFLLGIIRPQDTILLKGSRGMQMERVLRCSTTSSTR